MHGSPPLKHFRLLVIGGAVWSAVGAACSQPRPDARISDTAASATYVGSTACATCHASEYQSWKGSQHALAIQPASPTAVLGRFDSTRFSYQGVTTTFFRRADKFYVNTDGPDGALHDYEVAYTLGVYPLQQYLIPLAGGRYQALGIAWDSRPHSLGGQRWFHLYPGQRLKAGDPLHWTGIDQNWNYQCAECHSTNLRKGYDTAAATYNTTWAELSVGCEACHGPASAHLLWAPKQAQESRRGAKGVEGSRGSVGLVATLRGSTAATWIMDTATGVAKRSVLRTSRAEVETCGRCHARRGTLSEDYLPGRILTQTHRPALLDEGLYQADGQMQDEVYNYGSFRQSRMYRAGVTCSDCHDPHGSRLPSDTTCGGCHLTAKFNTAAHHHHRTGSPGSSCVGCHMPTRTYMVVDPRHDHGFKVPRPDLSAGLGTSNACTDCHRNRTVDWAARAAGQWYPDLARRPTWALALAEARQGQPEGKRALEQLVQDTSYPAMVRATAITLLTRYGGTTLASSLQLALWDPDPLVRTAGLEGLAGLEPTMALRMAAPLLSDSVRLVRIAAARMLAGQAGQMDPSVRPHFDAALAEYRSAELVSADRPEVHINLGNLALTMADPATSEQEYNTALRLDSSLVAGYVNLADLYRSTGRDSMAEPLLRQAVQRAPADAAVRQALGLLLVRLGRKPEALEQLARAAALAPDNPRWALVYGVALHDLRSPAAGIAELRRALERHPSHRELLLTLAGYSRETGDLTGALIYAKRVAALDPQDPHARRLIQELEAMQR